MKFVKTVAYIALLTLAVPLAYNALTYINFDSQYGFLRLKKSAIATGWYLPAYYAHVLVAGIILLLGFFQIHPTWGLRWPKVHRLLGKAYVGGILLFAAPGGLIMSLFITRGPWVLASFTLQCAVWFACTLLAYVRIRQGNVQSHRRWVLRSFAVSMAAITLRAYVFACSWYFDLSVPLAYATIAWLSWILNLAVCEWYLTLNKKRATS